eukprot:5078597-Alexandrium_andersonii.AAC.1
MKNVTHFASRFSLLLGLSPTLQFLDKSTACSGHPAVTPPGTAPLGAGPLWRGGARNMLG